MKPIVKWAGGKTQLLNKLIPLVPENYETYYEPFFGGGALFFALEPKKAVINDFNDQLVNLYKQVKNSPDELKKALLDFQEAHDGTKEFYYARRTEYNECLKNKEYSIKSAALFVYLNKAGFNGMYRVNSKNEFNIPFSNRIKVTLFDEDNFDGVSSLLANTEIRCGDFEDSCFDVDEKSFLFIDSPYYSTFDTYVPGGFSESDHIRLKNMVDRFTQVGAKCLITNSNEEFIKNLYKDYKIQVVDVKRMINSDASKRTGQEVIITNY